MNSLSAPSVRRLGSIGGGFQAFRERPDFTHEEDIDSDVPAVRRLPAGRASVHLAAAISHGRLPARVAGRSAVRAAPGMVHEVLGYGITHSRNGRPTRPGRRRHYLHSSFP